MPWEPTCNPQIGPVLDPSANVGISRESQSPTRVLASWLPAHLPFPVSLPHMLPTPLGLPVSPTNLQARESFSKWAHARTSLPAKSDGHKAAADKTLLGQDQPAMEPALTGRTDERLLQGDGIV